MTQHKQLINTHINQYLDYYCQLIAPGFAVLLKGEWGSGKTWFINKYREKVQEKKKKCLYVSLNGVTSFSQIEEAFLQQQLPFLGSKPVAIGRSLITQILKNSLKLDVNDNATLNLTTPSVKLTEIFLNLEQSILIFDDLERCTIDLRNLLGYINFFVEHQGLNVIIVADEEKLYKNENYQDIKEKLISQTFNVHLDFDSALEKFILKIKDSSAKEFLLKKIYSIRDIYEKTGYRNLRTLNKIVLDFERIFGLLPEEAKKKLDLLEDTLKILIVLSIEIQSGNLHPKNIHNLEKEYRYCVINQVSKYETSNQGFGVNLKSESPQSIFEKYPFINFYLPFPSWEWWESFLDKGILDVHELDKSLKSSKYFKDETTPDWVKLWHFYLLNDEDFERLLCKVNLQYINREFDDPGVIKHITGIFLHFSDAGVFHKSKTEILEDSKLYIEHLKNNKQHSLLSYVFTTGDRILGGYLGLGFQGKDFQEFNEFCTYIEKAQELVKINNMPNIGQELLTVMQSDVWRFQSMICLRTSPSELGVSQEYHKIPILKYIKETDFVEKLLSLEFEEKESVCSSLVKRYEIEIYNRELIEELDWLKSVLSLLQEEIARKHGKISGYTLKKYIEPSLREAINNLEIKAQ